jgi:hypothetical protein
MGAVSSLQPISRVNSAILQTISEGLLLRYFKRQIESRHPHLHAIPPKIILEPLIDRNAFF